METLQALADFVEQGKADEAKKLTQKLLGQNVSPDQIVQEGLIAGLDQLGVKFEKFEAFVPELITAGMAAQATLAVLRPKMTVGSLHKVHGTVVIGTVEGDIHDVGKNIVAMILEGGGFKVTVGADRADQRSRDLKIETESNALRYLDLLRFRIQHAPERSRGNAGAHRQSRPD